VDGLPVGVVTFLLTDIEGSTALWDQHPAVMAEVVGRHEQIVELAVRSRAGIMLRHRGEGDSTLSVFERASDAVAAAVELQHAMAAEGWPDGMVLRTRAVLHTGEAQFHGGDYVGAALNRAARIRALAAGGEILLSRATSDLVVDTLPAQLSLVEVGEHDLRGLRRGESLYLLTLLGVDHRASIDRLRTIRPGRATMIGREDSLARVEQRLAQPGIVTITGPGGIGKTRLMHEACDRLRDRFSRSWIVELVGVSDAVAVEEAIRAEVVPARPGLALQADSPAPDDLDAEIAARVGPARMLLVLDNCEHLLDAVARLVGRLLARCEGLSVLATSREALGLAGEQVVALGPLELPTAPSTATVGQLAGVGSVRLVLDRARDAGVELGLDPPVGAALAGICVQLDGIPLALELAAARLGSMSAPDLLARLGSQPRLLRSDRRQSRHQTLHAAIDWSYQLLDPSEQLLLRRLGIFTGGFTLDAVEMVCPDESASGSLRAEEIAATLAELVSKSLVAFDLASARYRLLEPVRDFARELLDSSGEHSTLAQRHAHWALRAARAALVSQVTGARLDSLASDLANMHTALDWLDTSGDHATFAKLVAALGYTWFQVGWRQGRVYAQRAGEFTTDAPPRLRAGVLLASAIVEQRGALRASREASALLLEQARIIYEDLDDRVALAWTWFFLGRAYVDDPPHHSSHLQAACDLFRATNQPFGEVWCLLLMGIDAGKTGQAASAREHFHRALAISEARGATSTTGVVIGQLAELAFVEGDFDRARQLYQRAITLQRVAGDDLWNRMSALWGAAWVEATVGELDNAETILAEGISLCFEIDDEVNLRVFMVALAVTALKRGDAHQATILASSGGWLDDQIPEEYYADEIVAKAISDLRDALPPDRDAEREGRSLGAFAVARRFLASRAAPLPD
jgi:predicted ATPase/class 3 adenylate cyclase